MQRKFLLGVVVFVAAFGILSVSMFESASVSYVFAVPTPTSTPIAPKIPVVEYELPYPGKVSPDSPLWVVKALRDRIVYVVVQNHLKKAELSLLYSDKRLLESKKLFEAKKPDLAFSTLSKGEKYLEIAKVEEEKARQGGVDTTHFLKKFIVATLKHRQVIEELIPLSPEDAKPEMVKVEDYSKNAYKAARDVLNSKGIATPKNPFNGD